MAARALAAGVLALAAACSATGSAGAAPATRSIAVRLHGVGEAPFELVSAGHVRPVDLYSEERPTASTKVQDDELMADFVKYLDDLGFDRYANPGTAPSGIGAGGAIPKAIEVQEGSSSAWWGLTPAADRAEVAAFGTAMADFLQFYNLTQGWQSVDNPAGSDYFERQKQGRSKL